MTQEDKARAYDKAIERAKKYWESPRTCFDIDVLTEIFPELKEPEDERIRKELLDYCKNKAEKYPNDPKYKNISVWIAWLEKQGEPQDKGEISDGYHTFNELYYYRMLYNAAFFNMLPKEWVHKSKKHHDGEDCFGGGWFIVMANLPTGQISNHYELKNWDLFQIPEKEVADKWDGHTPQEAAERLHKYLLEKQGEQKPILDFKASNWYVSKVDGQIHDMTYNPTDKAEPKFKVGDWIVNKTYNLVYRVDSILSPQSKCYYLSYNGGTVLVNFVDEQNYRLWTIEDAKDGDVLVDKSGRRECPFIFKETKPSDIKTDMLNPLTVLGYCGIGGAEFTKGGGWGDTANCIYYPATKEQRELLFKKMKESGYVWDAEKKELKKIEKKPVEEYNITGIGSKNAQGKLGEMIKNLKPINEVLEQKPKWSEEDEEF